MDRVIFGTSFDESEYIGTPPPGHRIIRHAVLFYGILEIESLDWLSPQGTKWLDYDLRKRASMGAEVNHGAHGFRLTGLYGDGKRGKFRIRVWIQGEKNMQARFLSMCLPAGFIILFFTHIPSWWPTRKSHFTVKEGKVCI